MADMKITLVHDGTKEAKEELMNRIRVGLEAVGIQAASAAREELQKSPKRIDTGLLRNSITHALDGESPKQGSYRADSASKYSGKTPPPGTYSGTTPKESDDKAAVYIGTNVSYAIYVHEGTDKMSPNPFLRRAVENNAAELVEILKSQIGLK